MGSGITANPFCNRTGPPTKLDEPLRYGRYHAFQNPLVARQKFFPGGSLSDGFPGIRVHGCRFASQTDGMDEDIHPFPACGRIGKIFVGSDFDGCPATVKLFQVQSVGQVHNISGGRPPAADPNQPDDFFCQPRSGRPQHGLLADAAAGANNANNNLGQQQGLDFIIESVQPHQNPFVPRRIEGNTVFGIDNVIDNQGTVVGGKSSSGFWSLTSKGGLPR
jgi:hypothetical protein